MIYVLLGDKTSTNQTLQYNKKIIDWCREVFQSKNIEYKILFCKPYMFEIEFGLDDIIFWNPFIAANNLDIVIRYRHSIVILERQTLLSEKVTEINPINENLAVNYGFFLMYLIEDNNENISREWRLAIQTNNYLMPKNIVLNKIYNNPKNYRKQFIERKEIVEDNKEIKTQVNLE